MFWLAVLRSFRSFCGRGLVRLEASIVLTEAMAMQWKLRNLAQYSVFSSVCLEAERIDFYLQESLYSN